MLIAFTVAAVVDWFSVGRGWKTGEYLAKPATLAFLVLYAAGYPEASWALLAALVFSLLGDIYLMLPTDMFIAGLGAFLLGHIAYVVAIDADMATRLFWLALIVVGSSPISYMILKSAPAHMRAPVAVYMLAIASMVASAFAARDGMLIAGSLLFFASDAMIGWNRFVQPFRLAPVAIIVTYHLGQLGLVWGLLAGA